MDEIVLLVKQHKIIKSYLFTSIIFLLLFTNSAFGQKQTIEALYIPLADHYAAIVAYERYRNKMDYADFIIKQMPNWDLLRALFQTGKSELAFVMSPLAMDMYTEKPHFNWIGLMHRDGNALAVNEKLYQTIKLPSNRKDRKPNASIANALIKARQVRNKSTYIAMPHLLSTHTVILYQYLKNHNASLSLKYNRRFDVQAIAIAPPKAPAYIKIQNARNKPAAFEQSLPWADIVETEGFGKVVWYSKDVLPSKFGHVECITLATKKAIKNKYEAIKEVNYYIHKAGKDIEQARNEGGEALNKIIKIIRKHIPAHTTKAIKASLNPNLRVINYQHLNIDKLGLKQIMDIALEMSLLKKKINIDDFANTQFNTTLTDK